MKAATAAKKVLADNAVTGQGLPKFGTQVLMNVINEMGALPTRNHRDVQFESAGKISAEAMHEPRPTDGKPNLVTNQACFGCTIACGRISKIDEKHFTVVNKPEYWGASGGLEYEAAWALGAACGVGDLEALTYANFVCNEDGIDPISFGATVGAAMELYDLGLIKEADVGFPMTFGSAEVLTKLTEMTARGEGFGKEIGQGSKRLCAKYGRPELSMTVKGQEFPAYDSRGIQGMGLAYATSNRGACHLRGYTVASRGARHPGQDRSARDRRQGRAGQGVPGRHRGVRFVGAVRVHVVRVDAGRRAAAARRPRAKATGRWRSWRWSASASGISSGNSTTRPGFTGEGRQPAATAHHRAGARPARPRGSSTASTRCCRSITKLRGWSKGGVPTKETLTRLGLPA